MLYLLYGSDTYRSRKKLREIIGEFRNKSGSDLDFHALDAEEGDISSFRHALEACSLFSEKKLVTIMYAFSAPHIWDDLLSLLTRIKDSKRTIVFLWDGEAAGASQKKQLSQTKPLCQKIQEFKKLQGAELSRFIQEEARMRDISLSPLEIARFASLKTDSWGIVNALEKFAISHVFQPPASRLPPPAVFSLGDAFFSSPLRARSILLSLLNEGHHDEFKLFSYLVNHARTLLTIQAYDRAKKSVPAHHGIHPFVIQKAGALLRALPSDTHMRGALARFFEEDVKIKTGATQPKDSLISLSLYKPFA